MIPWYYKNRFTNWLIAKPWEWNIKMIYRQYRLGTDYTSNSGKHYYAAPKNRLSALWAAIKFPHVHHWSEND